MRGKVGKSELTLFNGPCPIVQCIHLQRALQQLQLYCLFDCGPWEWVTLDMLKGFGESTVRLFALVNLQNM